MGILKNLFQSKPQQSNKPIAQNNYVDASSIPPYERQFYEPDEYYTYYSYPNTMMARRVITFEERKKTSFPSAHGLYVAEILLLYFCDGGSFPLSPGGHYAGYWWFEFGIRDVGGALSSLFNRGFLRWAPKSKAIETLKADDLKTILRASNLPSSGKKANLIERIKSDVPENRWDIVSIPKKYELTELGEYELSHNGYVPYMFRHPHKTTEDGSFGETFTVWDINRMFAGKDASNWRSVVGNIEKKRFGVDMANAPTNETESATQKKPAEYYLAQKEDARQYLKSRESYIAKMSKTNGDGFAEESQAFDLMRIGKDFEAMVQFFISIGKRFDAPALYREASALLHKYGLYEEELSVLDAGLKMTAAGNRHYEQLISKRNRVIKLLDR